MPDKDLPEFSFIPGRNPPSGGNGGWEGMTTGELVRQLVRDQKHPKQSSITSKAVAGLVVAAVASIGMWIFRSAYSTVSRDITAGYATQRSVGELDEKNEAAHKEIQTDVKTIDSSVEELRAVIVDQKPASVVRSRRRIDR